VDENEIAQAFRVWHNDQEGRTIPNGSHGSQAPVNPPHVQADP
jgi:hypothetical protein